MSREWLSLSLLIAVTLLMTGCRRAVPPSFSPGPEVVELTAELEAEAAEAAANSDSEEDDAGEEDEGEDAEEGDEPSELEIYQALQSQIGTVLAQRTGTPAKMILLGEEEHSKQLHQGYEVYARYCTQCHGVNGDGNGPIAVQLDPKPRNYTHGVFKFTSTPYGGKPRHADLVLTIRRGVTGTSMPSFDRLSDDDIDAVVEYVLALTYRGQFERELASYAFDDEELPDEEEGMDELIAEILEPWHAAADQLVMPVTPMPPMTTETVKAGHEIFLKQACNKCHGKFGRGGSMGGVDVGKDAWGNSAAAADLSSGMFHGGDRPIDIYRRIYSGINGTPMPAFKSMFEENPEVIWQLVHFIKETGNRRRLGLPPLSEADMPTDSPAVEEATVDEEAAEELVADEDEESEEDASEESTEIDEAEVDTVIETEDEAKEATETESEVEVEAEVEAAISSAA